MKTLLLIFMTLGYAIARPVQLQTEKKDFLLGEPIYLVATPDAPRFLSLEEGGAVLWITDSRGVALSYKPPITLCRLPNQVPPDLTFMTLIFSKGDFVFKTSGTYILTLHSTGAQSEPISDPLEITIKAPKTNADIKAFDIISENRSEYAFAVYLEGGDHLEKGMEILKRVGGFSNSYFNTAHFVKSINASRKFINYGNGSVREANLEEAIESAEFVQGALGPYPNLQMASYMKDRVSELQAQAKGPEQNTRIRITGYISQALAHAPNGKYRLKDQIAPN